MLEISNINIYGLEESIVASGLPMRAKSYTEDEFEYERSNLKKWLFEYNIMEIYNRLNYKPKGNSNKTDVLWHRMELNEIAVSECGKHCLLYLRDNNGSIKGVSKIDFKDLHKIMNDKWSLSRQGYVAGSSGALLHRCVLSEEGFVTEHKNRDTLDNRSGNLRLCSYSENGQNSKKRGVSFRKDRNKWRAYLVVDGRQISLGHFENEEDAINAHIKADLKYFKEFSPYYEHNIDNDEDYGFNEALKSLKRAIKLGSVPSGTGHDTKLKGIVVQFDVKYPQYWTPQFQRYHFADIVSSQSKMHRLTKMDIKKSCNKYVSEEVINHLNDLIAKYNTAIENKESKDDIYEKFMKVISNTPMGFEMTMRVTTNYLQLKTIYLQRKHHKLKEDWGYFCDKIENLPFFKELCLSK